MTKHTRYFENYQDAYNYYGGTEVPSNEIALVGNASYVFVSSDNSYGGGNTQYFDAGMTNDTIVVTMTENAYSSGSSYGYEQGYAYGYPLGYTEGTTYGESIGYVAGQAYGEEIGYAQGYEGGYSYGYSEGVASVPVPTGNVDITTTSQYNVTTYATAQVVDANLTAGNIADGVTILGVTGTYSGGITPTGTAYLQLNTLTDVSAYEFAYCEDTNGSYTAGYEGGTSYGYDLGYSEGLYAAPVNDKSLTFTASAANATVALNKNGSPNDITLSYSLDGGYTWAPYTVGTTITLANIGDTLKMKGNNATFSTGTSNYYKFTITGVEEVTGHVTSLLNEVGGNVTLPNYCFVNLFKQCKSIKTAPELPSTTLSQWCYNEMFSGCSSLTKAPELPATSVPKQGYSGMFYGCSALVNAPKLPATSVNQLGYQNMFYNCTSLVQAPMLNITSDGGQCCRYMFDNCTSIKKFPYVSLSLNFSINTTGVTIIHKRGTTVTVNNDATMSTNYVYNDSAPASMTSLWDDDPDVFMANVMAYYALNS